MGRILKKRPIDIFASIELEASLFSSLSLSLSRVSDKGFSSLNNNPLFLLQFQGFRVPHTGSFLLFNFTCISSHSSSILGQSFLLNQFIAGR